MLYMCANAYVHVHANIFIDAYASIFPVYYTVRFLNIIPDSELNTLMGQGTELEESRSETPHCGNL